ncbi:MAG TPA: helicase-related protein [Actinomycetota bacterium]|nr:helicase-related protein [Actinomycetota bacterium]
MNHGPPELVDNLSRYVHAEALRWLAENRPAPLSVATGYVRLGGLVALACLPGPPNRPVRLLLGAMPEPGLGAEPAEEPRLAGDRFRETLDRLRAERDFDAFPESRRTASLDLVERFLRSDRVEVRRFTTRFLHGKTYLFGARGDRGLAGEGAVLVTSANLTSGGLERNLELGTVSYQPSTVALALDWFDELWAGAEPFEDELLSLLFPPVERYDPQTIFRRALLELYGDEIEREAEGEVRAGGLVLTSFQEQGYRRARRIVEELGGVIYADGVGTGKTEVGLRFLEEYARERGSYALIITPAQLRESLWEKRRDEAGLPGQVVSYQELAADRQLGRGSERRLRLNKDAYRLVIVDEAHAFRNSDTTWYAALDRLLGGTKKDLVLLTATPVNNSLWDLHNLVMLFARHDAAFRATRLRIPSLRELFIRAGARDPEELREEILFPLVDAVAVRRDRRFIEDHYRGETFPDGTPVRFPRPRLEERRYDLDAVYPGVFHEVVETIGSLTMARYVPARYRRGSTAELAREEALAGLMQSQLLKRFESSVAAATETLRRMVLAHEALVEAWRGRGMVPSLATLRDLVRDATAGEPLPDLVEAALDEDDEAQPASAFDPRFLRDVEADLERLRALSATFERLASVPDPKLEALAEVLRTTPARKVAVFSSYADTVAYVAQAIELDPARFGGREVEVVVGTETDAADRVRKLERFCPRSVTGEPDFTPDREVDLLLSTDVLSEGQNLQEAQAVVSYDLPWNPQRVVQRNGRVIRLRSPHDEVFLYTLVPMPGDLEEILRLEARVRGKIAAANATFGMENPVLADIEEASRIYADEAERDLRDLFRRIEEGDPTLMDQGQEPGSGAFAGEQYRWLLHRLLQEGAFEALRRLPWGIGSAFVREGLPPERSGVFFACRTSAGERAWRFVPFQGDDLVREDLEMLRLIDPGEAPRAELPTGDALERAWRRAAEDICTEHNARLDPKRVVSALPPSQRWALEVLRSPDLPEEERYALADEALGVGRGPQVRRRLAELRRRASAGGMGVREVADAIVEIVEELGLRPEPLAVEAGRPITEADLGVVCFQVVLAPQR